MRGSRKGRAPQELEDWVHIERTAGIPPRYRNWPAKLRGIVLSQLVGEQTGQCVYCGRGIVLERHERYHVEHFRPQSRFPEHELDFENIFLSCGPRKDDVGVRETCGNRKGDWFEEGCHIQPASIGCCKKFFFGSSGIIQPDASPEALKMIEVLNLNDQELMRERAELIEEVDEELNMGVRSDELLAQYMRVSDGSRVSFANVAIRYLQEEMTIG